MLDRKWNALIVNINNNRSEINCSFRIDRCIARGLVTEEWGWILIITRRVAFASIITFEKRNGEKATQRNLESFSFSRQGSKGVGFIDNDRGIMDRRGRKGESNGRS